MSRGRPPYSAEFRRQMVDLVQSNDHVCEISGCLAHGVAYGATLRPTFGLETGVGTPRTFQLGLRYDF